LLIENNFAEGSDLKKREKQIKREVLYTVLWNATQDACADFLLGCKAVVTAFSRRYRTSPMIYLQSFWGMLHICCICRDSQHVTVCFFCSSNAHVTVTIVLHLCYSCTYCTCTLYSTCIDQYRMCVNVISSLV